MPVPDYTRSRAYRAAACTHLPFGVSSTPRGRQSPVPVVIEEAQGVHLTDLDGNRYIDFTLGYGPLLLGHTPDCVQAAVTREMARGLRTATVHRGEAALADLLAECVPTAEQTAFVTTGTEAVQLALRIARAATGRLKIAKFRANYHGWIDNLHVAGTPGNDGACTSGQDPAASADVVLFDWGDAAQVGALDSSFAAVILEPAAINPGCFAPPPGFLEAVRVITRKHGIVLIFDEVITGFRLGLGGAQQRYGVLPDLTVLGKVLGGGLPIGAVAGRRDIMHDVATGRLLHRGTFNGNPLSLAAGFAAISHLRTYASTLYPRLDVMAAGLSAHVNAQAMRAGVAACAQVVGSAVQLFVGTKGLTCIDDLTQVDRAETARLTDALLQRGIYALPRGLMYLGAPHDDTDMAATYHALSEALETLRTPPIQQGS
ncbi:aminotransferase class III-fold pyridoxal phosphate-dependent enzyme [Nguyenibacter vanlangensis]|uniref:Aminotransferase class III-fold pyridoxal phosphate-dependent enzyme n=1 Tax=Nguyenibacter vanlangensis TaxID=1216886 RepID=A0ABZ3D9H7_9PROT